MAKVKKLEILTDEAEKQIRKEIAKAIKKAHLPNDSYIISKIATYMLDGISANDAAELILNNITKEVEGMVKWAKKDITPPVKKDEGGWGF